MKKTIISALVIASFSIASLASAQSTVTGTLSSGGSNATTTGSTSLSGNVGSGSGLTGTVTSPSSGSSSSVGGGGGNGPIVGGSGGGGASTTVICPNLPNNLYSLPSGYEVLNGMCYPIGTSRPTTGSGSGTGIGTTAPGIPNTGEGGNAPMNDIVLFGAGLLGAAAGMTLLRRQFAR